MLALFSVAASAQNVDVDKLTLPDGFSVSVYAEIENPRQLAIGANNTVFVGSLRGSVWALINPEEDIRAREAVRVAEGLNTPNGVAYHGGDLFVGEIDRISTIQNIDTKLNGVQSTKTVTDDLPNRRHHGFKFLAIGPDDKIYFPVGAPCNVCLSENPKYASILRLSNDNWEYVARGVRNSVGFDFHPETNKLYFGDNGRDWLGDDSPACELNRVDEDGLFYGFPYQHALNVKDPEYGDLESGYDYVDPILELGAHVAPTGLAFYDGEMFPEKYKNNIFITLHGSWNRSKKVGYKVIRVVLNGEGDVVDTKDFISGWLDGETVLGRPAAPLIISDGSLLISDDKANVIYRITYKQ